MTYTCVILFCAMLTGHTNCAMQEKACAVLVFILLYIFKFNLVPRILRLLGQRVVTRRGSGAMEKIAFFGWLLIELALQISYH